MNRNIEARAESNLSRSYSLGPEGIRQLAKEAGIQRGIGGIKILIIDNYDSFTYNLYQLAAEILKEGSDKFVVDVARNDEITLDEIRKEKYNRLIVSPGPGDPSDNAYFGVCSKVLTELGKTTPVLGVCLGMQGMAYHFGGKVIRAETPMHGKTSVIEHDGKGVFEGLPQDLTVMRYHSLVVDGKSLPNSLQVTAKTNGEIMGLRHKTHKIEGVQFHPESIGTQGGQRMVANFIFQK